MADKKSKIDPKYADMISELVQYVHDEKKDAVDKLIGNLDDEQREALADSIFIKYKESFKKSLQSSYRAFMKTIGFTGVVGRENDIYNMANGNVGEVSKKVKDSLKDENVQALDAMLKFIFGKPNYTVARAMTQSRFNKEYFNKGFGEEAFTFAVVEKALKIAGLMSSANGSTESRIEELANSYAFLDELSKEVYQKTFQEHTNGDFGFFRALMDTENGSIVKRLQAIIEAGTSKTSVDELRTEFGKLEKLVKSDKKEVSKTIALGQFKNKTITPALTFLTDGDSARQTQLDQLVELQKEIESNPNLDESQKYFVTQVIDKISTDIKEATSYSEDEKTEIIELDTRCTRYGETIKFHKEFVNDLKKVFKDHNLGANEELKQFLEGYVTNKGIGNMVEGQIICHNITDDLVGLTDKDETTGEAEAALTRLKELQKHTVKFIDKTLTNWDDAGATPEQKVAAVMRIIGYKENPDADVNKGAKRGDITYYSISTDLYNELARIHQRAEETPALPQKSTGQKKSSANKASGHKKKQAPETRVGKVRKISTKKRSWFRRAAEWIGRNFWVVAIPAVAVAVGFGLFSGMASVALMAGAAVAGIAQGAAYAVPKYREFTARGRNEVRCRRIINNSRKAARLDERLSKVTRQVIDKKGQVSSSTLRDARKMAHKADQYSRKIRKAGKGIDKTIHLMNDDERSQYDNASQSAQEISEKRTEVTGNYKDIIKNAIKLYKAGTKEQRAASEQRESVTPTSTKPKQVKNTPSKKSKQQQPKKYSWAGLAADLDATDVKRGGIDDLIGATSRSTQEDELIK